MQFNRLFKPVYYISKLVGLAPFSTDSDDRYVVTYCGIAYSVTLTLVANVYSLVTVLYRSSESFDRATRIIDTMYLGASVIGMNVTVLSKCVYQKEIVSLLNRLEVVCNASARLRATRDVDKERRQIRLNFVAVIFTLLLCSAFNLAGVAIVNSSRFDFVDIGNIVMYNFPDMTLLFGFIQYYAFVVLARHVARSANEILAQRSLQRLRTTRAIYSELNALVERLNHVYSPQLLYNFILLLMGLSIISFYFTRFVLENPIFRQDISLYYTIYLSYNIFQVSLITVACESAENEARRTAVVLHRTAGVGLEAMQFSRQMAVRAVRFAVFGCFVIDRRLLRAVVATTLSYSLIVMQFEIGNSPK